MKIGLGKLGMTPEVFWQLCPRELWNAWDGWVETENERQRRNDVRARWQSFLSLQPYCGKDSDLKPEDLIKFDWEQTESEKVISVPTIEDFERIKKKYGFE